MADTLAPGGILMRICPMRLHRWVSLCETAVYSWLDDRAPTMGAAIAYYTDFRKFLDTSVSCLRPRFDSRQQL